MTNCTSSIKNWKRSIRKLAGDFFIDPIKVNKIIENVEATKTQKDTSTSMYQRAWDKLFELM